MRARRLIVATALATMLTVLAGVGYCATSCKGGLSSPDVMVYWIRITGADVRLLALWVGITWLSLRWQRS